MGDWIDHFSDQLERKDRQIEHVRQTLPGKAEDFWRRLTETLRRDIAELNSRYASRVGDIEINVEGFLTLHITKLDFPAYYIDLILNENRRSILLKSEMVQAADRRKSFPESLLNISLSGSDELVVSSDLRPSVTVDEISEHILKPIILGEAPASFALPFKTTKPNG